MGHIRAKIEHELDELMMGVENYFGATNPKRNGHIRCALDRIMLHREEDLIASAPETLREIGSNLADLLDADHWNNIEPMLRDVAAGYDALFGLLEEAGIALPPPDAQTVTISEPTPQEQAYLDNLEAAASKPVDMTYMVGGPNETAEQRAKRERDNLHDYTSNLIGFLQLLRCRDDIPTEVKDIMNTYPCVVDAVSYMTQIVRPDRKCPTCGIDLTVFDTTPCDTPNCPLSASDAR